MRRMVEAQSLVASTPPRVFSASQGGEWKRGRIFVVALCLALAAACALLIDIPVAVWAGEVRLPGDLKRVIRLAEVFGFGATVVLIILTAAVLDRRTWRIGLRLAASALGAGIVADGVKLLVARQRPRFADIDSTTALDTFSTWLPALNGDAHSSAYGYEWQSFPSAHSATAAGLAVGLALLHPRGRWLFAAFAALACFQRIDAEAHYLSDCLAGAAIGCVVAAVAARLPAGER